MGPASAPSAHSELQLVGKAQLPSRIGGNSGRGIAGRQACSVSVRVVDSRPQLTSGLFQSPMILAIARGGERRHGKR